MAYDETTPLQYGLSIGMDGEEEDPAAKGMRTLQAAWSVVGMLMGSGDEF
ncbi:Bacteriophage protein [Mycobacteroides abscessus subsp. abscessus]|nr:Bacteriophage protein [Mycobacteroides abscessus subsp. abscessus]